MKKLSKILKIFFKFAEKVYNCRYCGAPHSWVDPSGYICGKCGTANYPKREQKEKELAQQKQEIKEPEIIKEVEPIKDEIPKNKPISSKNMRILDKIENEYCLPYIRMDDAIISIVPPFLVRNFGVQWNPKTIEEIIKDLPNTSEETAQKALDNASLAGETVGSELLQNYLLHVNKTGNKIRLVTEDPMKIIDVFEFDVAKLQTCYTSLECIKAFDIPDWFLNYSDYKGDSVYSMLAQIAGIV